MTTHAKPIDRTAFARRREELEDRLSDAQDAFDAAALAAEEDPALAERREARRADVTAIQRAIADLDAAEEAAGRRWDAERTAEDARRRREAARAVATSFADARRIAGEIEAAVTQLAELTTQLLAAQDGAMSSALRLADRATREQLAMSTFVGFDDVARVLEPIHWVARREAPTRMALAADIASRQEFLRGLFTRAIGAPIPEVEP